MVKRSPSLETLVSTKTKCIKLIFIGKITLVPVAFLMALSILRTGGWGGGWGYKYNTTLQLTYKATFKSLYPVSTIKVYMHTAYFAEVPNKSSISNNSCVFAIMFI